MVSKTQAQEKDTLASCPRDTCRLSISRMIKTQEVIGLVAPRHFMTGLLLKELLVAHHEALPGLCCRQWELTELGDPSWPRLQQGVAHRAWRLIEEL